MDELQSFVENGLRVLGDLIATKTNGGNPCDNVAAHYKNSVFEMNSFCWCDGEGEHETACPPNFRFEYKGEDILPIKHPREDFEVNWYKYLGRGTTQSRQVSAKEWADILQRCINSI
jgi:hypothetical protein